MGGAPRHCSLRPRTQHGPWSPPIHHGCPRPRIFYGHLENSLPLSLRLYVLSLSLVSRFPLGSSLCRGSLLRPGGRLSRLLRPGGRLSRLFRPGGRLSRLLRPGGRLSRLLRPGGRLSRLLRPVGRLSRLLRPGGRLSRLLRPSGRLSRLLTCQSHLTPPPTCQSHLTPPPTCQSHLTPPPTCQSHLTPPPTCQSHLTPPPTCQSHLTSQRSTQCHLTSQRSTQCPFSSLRFCPPCPGGLLSHWPHMDLALRSLPRFHLHSTALLDYALCEASGSRPLGGGSVMNLVATHYISCTTLQLHITYGLHLPSFTALTHSHPPLHQSHCQSAVTN